MFLDSHNLGSKSAFKNQHCSVVSDLTVYKDVFSLHSNACLRNKKVGKCLKTTAETRTNSMWSRFLIMLPTFQPAKHFFKFN